VIASYPKVLTVGTRGTECLLEGEVLVQEKIDGSMFRWAVAAVEATMCAACARRMIGVR